MKSKSEMKRIATMNPELMAHKHWELRVKAKAFELALKTIRDFVDEQATDEALWSVPAERLQNIGEAYLQQELRALHQVIEKNCAILGLREDPEGL